MAVKIFFCYAREDEELLNKLKSHLSPLQRQGLIDVWHDRDISAGTEWEREISEHLNAAQIILLLISPDFMASDYCYGTELKRAIDRHLQGVSRVIPIILRHGYWQIEPLRKLQALPTDAVPIISVHWYNQDEAFFNVAEGIRKVVLEIMRIPASLNQKAPMFDVERIIKQSTQSDIVTLVKEAKDLEEQFIANGYTGSNNGPNILEQKGTLPVVLSAPHAVVHPRKGKPREAQWHTGALTLQLAQLTGASAVVYARTSDEDPNWGEPGLYKHKLEELVREVQACFVLDIHGLSDKGDQEINLGTAYGKALLGRDKLLEVLVQQLKRSGIQNIAIDEIFDADRPDTITLYTAQHLKVPAIQLGVAWSLRDFGHSPKKYIQLLKGLCSGITVMSNLYEGEDSSGQYEIHPL